MFVDASAIVAILTREPQADVREFLGVAAIRAVSIAEREAERALAAFSRYGTGRGHPAQLNPGDCFAYAVAKTHRTALLFTGDDFSKTDIAPAAPA
jgi:ribonuclease VapC